MDRQLHLFSDTLDEWLACQKDWMYLKSIFSAPDIQRQLPHEAKSFMLVDKQFKDAMRKTLERSNAMLAGTTPGPPSLPADNTPLPCHRCSRLVKQPLPLVGWLIALPAGIMSWSCCSKMHVGPLVYSKPCGPDLHQHLVALQQLPASHLADLSSPRDATKC